jgi:hypothetical protein
MRHTNDAHGDLSWFERNLNVAMALAVVHRSCLLLAVTKRPEGSAGGSDCKRRSDQHLLIHLRDIIQAAQILRPQAAGSASRCCTALIIVACPVGSWVFMPEHADWVWVISGNVGRTEMVLWIGCSAF